MTLSAVFDHVDRQRERSIERLIEYVRQPSISAQGIGIAEVAALLHAFLTRLGFDTRLVETPGWPVVVGRWDHAPGAPTVLLYGHYDVQPPDPIERWISPPFEPTIREGRLYARGVGDNKGQHFAQLLALESLLAVDGRLPCNVVVALEGEEEIGSPRMADFVRANRDLLRADLVITSDGPVHESGRPTLMFGVRGIVSFELRARGANRDLHSGNFGGIAPNPIWTLVHALASLKDEHGRVLIDGFYDRVIAQTPLEQAALAALPLDLPRAMRDLGLTRLDAPAERGYFERLSAWPTLTINGLHGGYGGAGSKTVLPCEAFAKCDIRLVEAMTVEDTFARVKAHLARHAPEVEVIPTGGMEPSRTPLESPFTAPIRQGLADVHGEDPVLVPAMGGSLPDYVFTKILGVPAFTVPYANHDEANHAPNENLELWRFIAGIKTGAAMLTRLGQAGAKSGA